jgi:hypothetical protein
VQFSIKFSRISDQLKELAQDNALLRARLDEAVKGTGIGERGSGIGEQ